MGFRISWLAVEGIGKQQLVERLGLRDTGEPDEANEAPLSAATLPTGWSVLWANDEEYATPVRAAGLAVDRRVLAVTVNETRMHVHARLFENGAERWHLWHEGDEILDHLGKAGELPPEAAMIEAEQRALQQDEGPDADVDFMFDVPTRLAKRLCGFKHDDVIELEEDGFTVVGAANLSGVVFLRRVFGG